MQTDIDSIRADQRHDMTERISKEISCSEYTTLGNLKGPLEQINILEGHIVQPQNDLLTKDGIISKMKPAG